MSDVWAGCSNFGRATLYCVLLALGKFPIITNISLGSRWKSMFMNIVHEKYRVIKIKILTWQLGEAANKMFFLS